MNIGEIYRAESGRVLATLIRLLGSFDLAEEATQEAFAAALAQWEMAADAYRHALSLASNAAEKRFLARRLAEVEARAGRRSRAPKS